MILDTATGQELARLRGQHAAWLDDHRLVELDVARRDQTDVWLAELGARVEEHRVQALEGFCIQPKTDGHTLLVLREQFTGRAYVVASNASAQPADLATIEPLETGAESDMETVGWTEDGQAVTMSAEGETGRLVRTKPGQRGVIVTSHVGVVVSLSQALRNILFYAHRGRGSDRRDDCEVRAVDVSTGAERRISDAPCADLRAIPCTATRCIDRTSSRWLDPVTLKLGELAPAIPAGAHISPDGTKTVLWFAGQIVVRDIDGSNEHVIKPNPQLDNIWDVDWVSDGTFLVVTDHDYAPESLIARLQSDGSWRVLARANAQLLYPRLSPDLSQLAVTRYASNFSWLTMSIDL
jgi:hypothetical protein